MKPIQAIAWAVCLLVAFLACVIAAKATYRTAILEKQFEAAQEAAAVQSAAVDRANETLDRLDKRMEFLVTSSAARAQVKNRAEAAERAGE